MENLTKLQKEQRKIAKLIAKGQLSRAKEQCAKQIRKSPNDINLLNLDGIILYRMNRVDDGIRVLKDALAVARTANQKAVIYNSLGQLYRSIELEESLKFHRLAVGFDPLAEHLTNLASLELSNGLGGDAIRHAKSSVLKSPEYLKGWEILCSILNETGRFSEALEFIDEVKGNSVQKLRLMIDAYVGMNNHGQSLHYLEHLITLPNLSDITLEYCFNIFEVLGETELAVKFIQNHRPKNFAYRMLLDLKASNVSDVQVEKFMSDLESPKIGLALRRRITFALASFYKKSNRNKWFALLERANGIIPKSYEYNENEVLSYFDVAMRKDLSLLPTSLNQSKTPIFIIGMPRAGTTLTESILGAHSQVFACGEATLLESVLCSNTIVAGHEKQFTFIEQLDNADQQTLTDCASTYLKKLRQHNQSATFLVDKMPHNFVFAAAIPKLFPQAKIIHVKRNPIANILSIFEQDFTSFHAYASSIKNLVQYYKKYQEYMKNMSLYIPKEQIFELSYDELVLEPELIVKDMLSFCQLKFEKECLQFHKQVRTVRTSSRGQVTQSIYTDSLKPWSGLETELAYLIAAFPEYHDGKVG